MSVETPITTRPELEDLADVGRESLYPDELKVLVGRASCGKAAGADDAFDALEQTVADAEEITVESTGCLGFCAREPLVEVVYPDGRGIVYEDVRHEAAVELGEALIAGRDPSGVSVLGVRSHDDNTSIPSDQIEDADGSATELSTLDFYANQERIVLRNAGLIDPESVAEYVARGGYFPLWDALHGFSPEEVIEEIQASNLRGRGGAGFPTGLKWELTRNASGEEKYVICNADEGDPGAYMDRSVLESDPFAVIEGMTIGGFAIGAETGIVFVRAEYPLAIRRLEEAIEAAREYGLLGEDILGTGVDFDVEIKEGAGAFVAGEETALIKSIESKRGEPEPRPPYPAESGLYGQPTNINNVETWANVPRIVEHGASWFDDIGTEASSGTKVFSLTGDLDNTGLVEVPMGTSIEEIVYEIGGADPGSIKAVQTGGPSGGCIATERFETPVDYDSLQDVGSIMGSGGMIVMDQDTCMVEVARYFLSFTQEESCGKCPPCRIGTKHMLDILETLTEGRGSEADIERLEELSTYVAESSLCGLGQTAPTPVESTLRYFRSEYEAHLDGECPAGECVSGATHDQAAELGGEDV
ncbi:MAG: NADH-ubiquinone oxidoreductase-F iron-sulfur binding region domain-containing protein [Halodesulfurarchaeum sp.]